MACPAADIETLRRLSENKIVVVQIDDRLNGQLAGATVDGSTDPDHQFDETIVGVSALNNYHYCVAHPDYFYIFVEPPATPGPYSYRDIDGDRPVSAYWGKVYALAMCMRVMPEARWFLALDTDAFLGVTDPAQDLRQYVQLAERSDRHVLLQACRTSSVKRCPDFWGRILGAITPGVYREPMAFNSGAVLVRQTTEGRAFVHTWLGLTSNSVGPSPLEQRFSALQISVTFEGLDGIRTSNAMAYDVTLQAIKHARAQGAPILEVNEEATIAHAPTLFREIETTKKHSSAVMDNDHLRFNLRSVTGDDSMRRLAQWITEGGHNGPFAQILRDCLARRCGSPQLRITGISQNVLQDRSGEFLVEWPGDQERLSWVYSLQFERVFVVPWSNDPSKPCLQYFHPHQYPLSLEDTVFAACPSPIWHPCDNSSTKLGAQIWVASRLTLLHGKADLSLLRLPVLRPQWGEIEMGGETCTLEAILDRIGKGQFELHL